MSSSADPKHAQTMGFVMPPGSNEQHGFINPIAGRDSYPPTNPVGAPYPPMNNPGGPYPPSNNPGGPFPPSNNPDGPYPPSNNPGGPYSPVYNPGVPYPHMNNPGGPYPPAGDAYPSQPGFQPAIPGNPYPPSPYPPSSGGPSYPGSPGFNTSGDPLVAGGYKPGQPAGDGFPKDDMEFPLAGEESVKGFDFSDKKIRMQFIRKVYAILMFQLLVTFGFVALCYFHEGIQMGVQRNPNLLWIAVGVTFVTLIPMVCCKTARRKFPMNFIFLTTFTLAQGFLLGMVTTRYEADSVLIAVGITVAVCLTLTLFAFQTKYDFTTMGGTLLVMLIVLLLMGFVAMLFPGDKMRVVYGALGALVFSLYLIYDTQLIIGGSHKVSISPEEYIFAALNIYLDVINLFMYILMIVGQKK